MRRFTLIVAGVLCTAACEKRSASPLAPTAAVAVTAQVTGAASAAVRLALTRFFAFGDSITWGEDGRNDISEPLRIRPLVKVDYPYPSLLTSYLQGRYTAQMPSVANEGCRGEAAGGKAVLNFKGPDECTGGGIDAVDRFQVIVQEHAYDAVLLMEGANDIGEGEDGPDAAISGLDEMIHIARAAGIRVFLATIPPEQQNADPLPAARNHAESDVLAFNDRVRALARSDGVTLVDVYAAFPSPDVYDLYALGLLSRDGLHPLEGGYEVIAGAFFNALVNTLELPPAVPTDRKS